MSENAIPQQTPKSQLAAEVLSNLNKGKEYAFGEYPMLRIADMYDKMDNMDIYLKDRSPFSLADSLKEKGFTVSLEEKGNQDGFFKANIRVSKNGVNLLLRVVKDEGNVGKPYPKGKEPANVLCYSVDANNNYTSLTDKMPDAETVYAGVCDAYNKRFDAYEGFNDEVRDTLENLGFKSKTPLPERKKNIQQAAQELAQQLAASTPQQVAPQVVVVQTPGVQQVQQLDQAALTKSLTDALVGAVQQSQAIQQKVATPTAPAVTTKQEVKASMSFKDRYLAHATEAAFDTAAEQIISNTRKAIVKVMEKAGKDSNAIEVAKAAMESPVGYAALGLALGEALAHIPLQNVKNNPKATRLSEKLIQKGMAHGFNAGIEAVMDTILPMLGEALRTLPEVEIEEEAKQLAGADSKVRVSSTVDNDVDLAVLSQQLEQTSAPKQMSLS